MGRLTQYEKPPEFDPSTAQAQRNDDNSAAYSAGGPPWGVPRSYKAFVMIVILGMKLVTVVLMWVAGVGYIALSDSNQSLIINTLVAGFVNDDQLVFLFTTSHATCRKRSTRFRRPGMLWMRRQEAEPSVPCSVPCGVPSGVPSGIAAW